jgi:putative transposase
MHRHELTDAQWAEVSKLLPTRTGPQSLRGDRNFINAVLWIAKTGAPWRDLLVRFGPWKTIYNRFDRWSKREVWRNIFHALALSDDEVGVLLDGSVIRAHQDAAGGKGGLQRTRLVGRGAVFRPSSTRSSTRRAGRSTSN